MVEERIEKREILSPSHGPVAKMMGRNFVDTIDIMHLILSLLREKILAKVHMYHQIRELLLNR